MTSPASLTGQGGDEALKIECIGLIRQGTSIIPAIKRVRQVKGLALKEAWDWVNALGVRPPEKPAVTRYDPVTALVALRAEVVRLAHEVEALTDERSIVNVRKLAPMVASRLRDAAMRPDMQEASKR